MQDFTVLIQQLIYGISYGMNLAVAAAKRAFPAWQRLPAKERIRLLRRVGEIIAERVYDISAALSLEVGKNRLEWASFCDHSHQLLPTCGD